MSVTLASTTTELHRGFKDQDMKARRVFETLRGGGIAILPVYAGYGIFGATDDALDRIYAAKRRGPDKMYTLVGTVALHREVHVVDRKVAKLVDRVTGDLDLALGIVADLRSGHPHVDRISPRAMAHSTRDRRMNMILNSGVLMDRLAEMSIDEALPVFGTSANVSGLGLKGRVEDIEEPVRRATDLVIDEGPLPGFSSTIVDLARRTTIRFGHRYQDVRAIAASEFALDLPELPEAPG